MLRHNTSGEDAVANANRKAEIAAAQAAAKAEDARLRRAAATAGRDRRSIGGKR